MKNVSGYRIVRVFRNYSAFSIVASSALLVSATNVTQGKAFNEALSGYIGGDAGQSEFKERFRTQTDTKDNLALVALAENTQSIDPNEKTEELSLFDVESPSGADTEVVASVETNIAKDPEESQGLTVYAIQDGDTLGSIAKKFNITVNTILWANDIDNENQIKPGDEIFILPVAGLSYTIAEGDSLDDIAKKYNADKAEIIAYNKLPADGTVTEGQDIIIPNGEKEEKEQKEEKPETESLIERRQYASAGTEASESIQVDTRKGGTGNRFPYGYCTWYVAQKRYVPWRGNAGAWLANAKAMGFKTGKTPVAGSIVVTTENRYYGHVAYVEKVSGGNITVSEMNYAGWGKTTRRTLSKDSRVIRGYIY